MPPEVAPGFRGEVRKLIDIARYQIDRGAEHVDPTWPKIGTCPEPGYKTRGSPRTDRSWLFPGGVGCFFGDPRSAKDSPSFDLLICYRSGRLIADFAFPPVAINMMYARRSVEQSVLLLGNHVEGAPRNAASIQGKLRAFGVSLIDRIRHFGGGG